MLRIRIRGFMIGRIQTPLFQIAGSNLYTYNERELLLLIVIYLFLYIKKSKKGRICSFSNRIRNTESQCFAVKVTQVSIKRNKSVKKRPRVSAVHEASKRKNNKQMCSIFLLNKITENQIFLARLRSKFLR